MLLFRLAGGALLAAALAAAQPRNPYEQAAALLGDGKAEEAERLLRRSLEQQPDDPRALGLLGVALDTQKRYAEAEPFLKRAAGLAPGAASLWNNLGNHYLATGKPEQARGAFLKVLGIQPKHPNANLQMAQLAEAGKRGAEALTYLDRLDESTARAPEAQLLRARALIGAGRAGEASAILDQLETQLAGDPRAAYSLGLAWAEAKRYEQAEKAFARALESDPANFDILYNLALAATRAGRLDRAREVFQVALAQRPDDVDALYGLAQVHAAAKQFELAAIVLAPVQTRAPDRSDILLLLARCFEELGYFGDAATAYSKYLKLKPEDAVARRERGFSLVRAGDLSAGLPDLEWYAARHPKDPMGLVELAIALIRDEPAKALAHLNRAIELEPEHADARHARGVLYYTRAQPEKALPDLEFVVARQPDNARALDALAKAYLQCEKPAQAAAALERAAKLAPNDPKVLMHYSQALRAVGREQESRAALARFREIGAATGQRRGQSGLFEYLTLPPAEQRARYASNLRKLMESAPRDASLKLRWARQLLAENRTAEAVAAMREVLALKPEPAVLAECGRTLVMRGEYAAAREFLEPAAAADPRSGARLDLAIAAFHISGAPAGLAELDRTPEELRRGDYHLLRARILDAAGRFEEAVASLNRAFRAEPTRADLYLDASNFLLKHGRHREMLELLEAAARTVPDSPEILLTQAIALELLQRNDDALKLLKDVELRWPEWYRPYLVHGIILEIHNQPAEARRLVETAIALGAETAEAYFYLALTINRSDPENNTAAETAVAQALRLNPDDPYACALAGKLAMARGEYKAAIEHLEVATRLFPKFAQAHYALANAYRALGDEDRAMAAMKEVRRLREENPDPELEAPPAGDILFTVRPAAGVR